MGEARKNSQSEDHAQYREKRKHSTILGSFDETQQY